ncbi:MAG: tetratricopeptide repeat protein [Ignavibacteriae bacterium]|nr:tetratricopeptide repeat protein [Ignavibacteria bacterium]MBI3364232.1 tetratricopeptide repeat protein [Ignavibacteriota bacterium]
MLRKHALRATLLFLVSCLTVCSPFTATAQPPKRGAIDVRLRLAQSYERTGDFEAALKLYQELYKQDSTNYLVGDALRRTYLQLKRYDDAIALLEKIIRFSPNDVNMIAQLGAMHYLKSDEQKAAETWERAIALSPKQPSTYTLVASSVTQSRLFDRAIAIYHRGRAACSDPTLFTVDIAYLYSITLKYPEATKEYMSYVRQNPAQLGYVQSRIGMYTGKQEGLAAATKIIEEGVQSESNNLPFQYLLAWVYMEGKKFDRAYDVYRSIDENTKAGGHEIYNFAQRALHERAYTVSSRAFQDIVARYSSFDRLAETKFGYAQSLEASDDESDTLKLFGSTNPFPPKERTEADPRPLYTGAIAAYDRVVTEFPKTELAARALFRTGIIKQEKFFDLDGARSTFEALTKRYPMFAQIYMEGTLRLGDVYLAIGALDKAQAEYQAVAGHGLLTNPLQEQAALHLAEILYFQANFKDALEKLKSLAGNAISDATNDALSLQIFIQDNLKQDVAVLKEFAKGDLLRRQRKLPEALTIFESIVQNYPKSDLMDEALINIGDLLTHMTRYPDAIGTYERLLKDFPESISLDRTLMKLANVYERGLRDSPKAIATYQKLLEQYPNSIYVSEARKRIRELRGDNI